MARPGYYEACTVIKNASGVGLVSAEFAQLMPYTGAYAVGVSGKPGVIANGEYFYVPGNLESYFASWHPGLKGRRMYLSLVKSLETDTTAKYHIVSLPTQTTEL